MASNNTVWSLDFCLACDTQTEGNAYCSEVCRLAEYEVSSTAGSAASSPTSARSPSWPTTKPTNNGFFMEPPYNFGRAQAYGTTPAYQHQYYSPSRPRTAPVSYKKPVLTPSSSQSSLFSMQSTTSSNATEPAQVSDESKRALREYAGSFDQSRYSRRQSQ